MTKANKAAIFSKKDHPATLFVRNQTVESEFDFIHRWITSSGRRLAWTIWPCCTRAGRRGCEAWSRRVTGADNARQGACAGSPSNEIQTRTNQSQAGGRGLSPSWTLEARLSKQSCARQCQIFFQVLRGGRTAPQSNLVVYFWVFGAETVRYGGARSIISLL